MPLRFILTVVLVLVLTNSKSNQSELKYPLGWSEDGTPPFYSENDTTNGEEPKLYFRKANPGVQKQTEKSPENKNNLSNILVPVFYTFMLPNSPNDIPKQLKVSFMYHLPDDIPDIGGKSHGAILSSTKCKNK